MKKTATTYTAEIFSPRGIFTLPLIAGDNAEACTAARHFADSYSATVLLYRSERNYGVDVRTRIKIIVHTAGVLL